jgi:hypothetical protein
MGIDWTFNFDAGWGTFGFGNSLYRNPRDEVELDLSDQWFEGYVKPALSAVFTLPSSSQIYGKVSVVGERTYGSAPPVAGADVSSFGPEDASIGWRSGTSIGSREHAIDVMVGRGQYVLGHGMLLMDGAAEGGSRGGYWTNARKAFELAAVGRVGSGPHTAEVFYLDRDDLPEDETGTRLWGANYELSLREKTTIGVTYMKLFANPDVRPERDGLNVFNVRAYTSPVPDVPDLSFEFEYASERNGEALRSDAWSLQAAYQFSAVAWTPKVSYRYAAFGGDDPDTPANEAFDPLMPGFHDWGTWWQGEIAGEYFLSNSNLLSHQGRVHADITDALGGGVMVYAFRLDRLPSADQGVTSREVGAEVDVYADWQLNDNFTLSFVGAFANPGAAVQQSTGRTSNFVYGMAYVAYGF